MRNRWCNEARSSSGELLVLSKTGCRLAKSSGSLNVVVDRPGLKHYGEDEWQVRKPGYSKRRTWRKLQFDGNPDTGETRICTVSAGTAEKHGRQIPAITFVLWQKPACSV